MDYIAELRRGHQQLADMLHSDGNADTLQMGYSEFMLSFYFRYANTLPEALLAPHTALALALSSLGISAPEDRQQILLDTFYLSLHIQK